VRFRQLGLGLLIAAITGLTVIGTAAHEVPADVRINAFVRPEGNRLELLIRVPLAALQDVEFPQRGQGYIDLGRADEALRGAAKVWLIDNIDLFENGVRLSEPRIVHARVSLPSDRSFTSYRDAMALLAGPPLDPGLDLYWEQQLLDVLLEYPIGSDGSEFAIHPRVDRFARIVSTALRFLPPDGSTRGYELSGNPGVVQLDPRWHQAALRFVVSGFWHILEGSDHLLFLLCLVIPFRRLRPLVVIVTAFTIAHSISLIGSALGFVPDGLWFPPLIETLIAVTIVYMAIENIVQAASGSGAGVLRRRWMFAFWFGLVHGFGFSFALRESLQFAGDHLLASLVAFNLGVEFGQLAVLLVLVPAIGLLFRHVVDQRIGIVILSALVTHIAWHWMLERWEQLAKFSLPNFDAAFLASTMRGLMALLMLGFGVWLVNGAVTRWLRTSDEPTPADIPARPLAGPAQPAR
jgi:hypothetical protein